MDQQLKWTSSEVIIDVQDDSEVQENIKKIQDNSFRSGTGLLAYVIVSL